MDVAPYDKLKDNSDMHLLSRPSQHSPSLVVATGSLKVKPPWSVQPSRNYPGRYFFHNFETNEQKWSLHQDILLSVVSLDDVPPHHQQAAAQQVLSPVLATIHKTDGEDKPSLLFGNVPPRRTITMTSSSKSIEEERYTEKEEAGTTTYDQQSSLIDESNVLFSNDVKSCLEADDGGVESTGPSAGGGTASAFTAGGNDESSMASKYRPKHCIRRPTSLRSLPSLSLPFLIVPSSNNPFTMLWRRGATSSRPDSSDDLAVSSTRLPSLPTPATKTTAQQPSSCSTPRPTSPAELKLDKSKKEEEGGGGGGTPLFSIVGGLGRGSYSVVIKVQDDLNGRKAYAMKVIHKKNTRSSSEESRKNHRSQVKFEYEVMTKIASSPFIQKCHYAYESPSSIYFVLDFNSGGDLFYHLTKRIENKEYGFQEKECQVILAELFLALEHLHKHNIIHRDVKVENVMLDAKGHVKLIDFGLSVYVIDSMLKVDNTAGSLIYMAPEILNHRLVGRCTDWWAFGILAHELFAGRTPWSSLTNTEIIRWEIVNKVVRPPSILSKCVHEFLRSLLCHDISQRLGTKKDSDIKTCPFFKHIDWEAMSKLQHSPAFVLDNTVNVGKDDQVDSLCKFYKELSSLDGNYSSGQKKIGKPDQWMLGFPDISAVLQK